MSSSVSKCSLLILSLFGIFLFSLSARASDVFEVKGIYVDVTGESVTEARKMAMRESQGRAFDIMLKRLTLKTDWELLPWVEPKERAQYIRDFSVSGEKSSDVRYLATYTYHFKADAIRSLLRSRNIAFAETTSKAVLILPLLEDGTRLSLWEEPNLWRDAWSELGTGSGLVPLALPLGDIADISGLPAQKALEAEPTGLMNMAQRYGVNSSVVAQMVVAGRNEAGEPNNVDLIINRVGSPYEGRSTILGVAALEGEDTKTFLKRAAQEVIDQIEESWKRDNLLQFGTADVVAVNMTIDSLGEWLDVKKRLQQVPVVRRVELALLSRNAVQLNLHFIGKLDQLIGNLHQVDLDLTVEGENWSLVNLTQRTRP